MAIYTVLQKPQAKGSEPYIILYKPVESPWPRVGGLLGLKEVDSSEREGVVGSGKKEPERKLALDARPQAGGFVMCSCKV